MNPKPWPYNHIKEPRPADWGIGMTICIAAISLNEGIVCVSDQMLSTADMSGDIRTVKFRALGSSWIAMFSGDDISPVTPIIEAVQKRIRDDDEEELERICQYFADSYKRQVNEKAEIEVLGTLGMSLEEFRTKGLKQLGPDVFNRLLYDIQNIRLSLDFLVCGYDNRKQPHIFTVSSPGSICHFDLAAFWAIGSGQTSALGHLFNLRHTPKYQSISNAVYCLCEAKFHAESAPGVGKGTHMTILRPNGRRFGFYGEELAEIRQVWEKSKPPDVPFEILARMTEMVDAAETKDVKERQEQEDSKARLISAQSASET